MYEAVIALQELLRNPVVQSSAAPFLAGLVAAAVLFQVRLEGLAAIAGFLATVALVGSFALDPLTATRKIVIVGTAAALLGAMTDLAFKPTRFGGPLLGLIFGFAALWVFATVLRHKLPVEAVLIAAGLLGFTVWLVAASVTLQHDPARASASGLMLGLGSGICATLGGSALIGQYGMGLGAACGGFIVLLWILGPRVGAGHALTLAASALAALLASGAVLLAQLHPVALAPLALVPLAARLPLSRAPLWMQPVLAAVYTGVPAAGACGLAWLAGRGWSA